MIRLKPALAALTLTAIAAAGLHTAFDKDDAAAASTTSVAEDTEDVESVETVDPTDGLTNGELGFLFDDRVEWHHYDGYEADVAQAGHDICTRIRAGLSLDDIAQTLVKIEIADNLHGGRVVTNTAGTHMCHTPWMFMPKSQPKPKPAPKPEPAPEQSGACHPNYSPCLPNNGDLDCGDVGEPVTVLGGYDPYQLDSNGDGSACTS